MRLKIEKHVMGILAISLGFTCVSSAYCSAGRVGQAIDIDTLKNLKVEESTEKLHQDECQEQKDIRQPLQK